MTSLDNFELEFINVANNILHGEVEDSIFGFDLPYKSENVASSANVQIGNSLVFQLGESS